MHTFRGSALVRAHAFLLLLACACSAYDDDATLSNYASVGGVTWESDIALLVADKCVGCHQRGGIAPFSMQDYASARAWAPAMADAVEQGRMPPFLADETEHCQPRLPWAQDLRLTRSQKRTLRAWAQAGAPEGERAEGVTRAQPELVRLPREDVVMRLPEPIEVRGDRDIHTCVLVDPGLDRDSYVTGRLVTAGNARVLHHVVSYVVMPGKNADGSDRDKRQLEAAIRDEHGVGIGGRWDCFGGGNLPNLTLEMLDGWAPGGLPNLAPPNSGQPLDRDALILLDVHYHPTGQTELDVDTRLSLMLADERPALISRVLLFGNARGHDVYESGTNDLLQQPGEDKPEFLIPAEAKDHVEEMTWTWNVANNAFRVYAAATHMHYVGRDMRVTLERAKSLDDECLIQTPQWNFNWQRGYAYAADFEDLPQMGGHDVVRLRCVYDNTMQNRFVAAALADRGLDAPVDVALGEDSLDEMCVAGLGIIYPNNN